MIEVILNKIYDNNFSKTFHKLKEMTAFDENMQTLKQKGIKAFIFGDLNLNTNLSNPPPATLDYLHTLDNNAFCNHITSPTRVTSDSETIIDHILTNVTETAITPGVVHYKISDHHIKTSNYLMVLNFVKILRFPLLCWSANC